MGVEAPPCDFGTLPADGLQVGHRGMLHQERSGAST